MSRLARAGAMAITLAATASSARAHVGNPNTVIRGRAGAYEVQVMVRPAGVVPGRADIIVRVEGDGVRRVTVNAAPWSLGVAGAPSPDELVRDAHDPHLYATKLWLMTSALYAVRVHVDGSAGGGTLVVPIANVATRTLGMERTLVASLVVFGVLLVAGLFSIVRAAATEALRAPGEPEPAGGKRRARTATAVTALLLVGAVGFDYRWWDDAEREHRGNLFRIMNATAHVVGDSAIRFEIADSLWTRVPRVRTPLVLDHGRLMHLFLVRSSALDVLVHLHPVTADTAAFVSAIPAGVPAGTYGVYADIVHASGFSETLVDTVSIATTSRAHSSDADDAWSADSARPAGDSVILSDGARVRWAGESTFRSGVPTVMRFSVVDASGRPASLEPYLGMAGHLVVTRESGDVFDHLHPMGTVSSAVMQKIARGSRGDTSTVPADSVSMNHGAMIVSDAPGTVAFPFVFPKPGRYRVWLQVRIGGAIRTAAFEAQVPNER